ncbi:hypothetical protein ML401_35430 (plasmid) [Bradyrhizobium sp. 62B]|uniref:hypothetical protein n=1 Tax=Bradyrhizobium sp. 62B TaxID=2898442 RepID=UPI002557F73C|nr:hypothetical protein ML401_35430 [Bradyrhizobium sp. 62B]
MRERLIPIITVAVLLAGISSSARSEDYASSGRALPASSSEANSEAARNARDLIGPIAQWLASNYELPSITEAPDVRFAPKTKLARMRAMDSAQFQGVG